MGTLGKILLFVNFLAFGGLFYAATQDWAARTAAAANALRHQLVIVGMPVDTPKDAYSSDDSIPLDITISGGVPVDHVRAKFLEDHFQGTANEEYAGGKFPRTQLDEVKEAEKKLFAKLSSLSPREQLNLLSGQYSTNNNGTTTFTPGLLTLMAESYGERAQLRALNEPAQFQRQPAKLEANAKLAMDIMSQRFEAIRKVDPRQADADAEAVKAASEALRKTNDEAKRKYESYMLLTKDANADPADVEAAMNQAVASLDKLGDDYAKFQAVIAGLNKTACRDESDRRKRIAHLLMHLSESAGWQKRVALVVGLRTYLSALSDHVNRFQKMISSNEQQVVLDQARFADEYELLKTLANGQSLLLQQQVNVRVDQQLQRSLDEEAARQRLQLLERRRQSLADLEADVKAVLAVQAETEQELFTVQKQIGETLQKNLALELELAEAEKKP